MPVFSLTEKVSFPPPEFAEDSGLLAMGGDLCVDRLLTAYKQGIFPWYEETTPILWWAPDPRMVLFPEDLHISKSLKKIIKKNQFEITFDKAFGEVISSCAYVRLDKGEETWITPEMVNAYIDFHRAGYAHSVEVWHNGELAGGVYGVALGRAFFGESMFTNIDNASKVGFVYLVEHLKKWGFRFIDCQVATDNLERFGAKEIPRKEFMEILENEIKFKPGNEMDWVFDNDLKIFG